MKTKIDNLESDKLNPVDKEKVTDIPHLLPYAHSIGSAIIRPLDEGRIKGVAMTAMYEQTGSQLYQIKEQVEKLLAQAQDIHERIDVSEKIYLAKCAFEPVMGKIYHLYEKTDGSWILSMVSEEEWGPEPPYFYLASARLLHDHTWDLVRINSDKPIFDI